MATPTFESLDDVEYGRVEQVSPLIRRVIAENPSKFTYRGTGTYIVGHGDVAVIDPGPLLDSHRAALTVALAGERVRAILVTHCHADHSPLAAWLREETGAPTIAYGPHPRPDTSNSSETNATTTELTSSGPVSDALGRPNPDQNVGRAPAQGRAPTAEPDDGVEIEESTDYDFVPDEAVADGEVVVSGGGLTMTAVHTPGHTSNHMCWSLAEERALFTGDHVMGWSTTVVSPPDGDMTDYIASLRKVAERADEMLWPTHGPPRDDGPTYVSALVAHRLERERQVLDAVRTGHATIPSIVQLLYADVREELHKPAGRSVWGHLAKLVADGRVAVKGTAAPALDSSYVPA